MRYITTLLLVLLPLSCLAGGVEEMLGALLVGKLAHDSPEAGRILQQVIQQRPRNRNGVREYHLPQQTLPVVERADDWIQRGKSLGEQGQWNESLICFQRAIRLEPLNPEAHYCAGIAHTNLGNIGAAQQEQQILQAIVEGTQRLADRLNQKMTRRMP